MSSPGPIMASFHFSQFVCSDKCKGHFICLRVILDGYLSSLTQRNNMKKIKNPKINFTNEYIEGMNKLHKNVLSHRINLASKTQTETNQYITSATRKQK
eukprot:Gb_08241 [translate_table: standard]